MAQIKLNTIQIVLMADYKNLLIQIIHMAHICENDMIQIKDMFQIVATWLQFSTEEYAYDFYWIGFGIGPFLDNMDRMDAFKGARSYLKPWICMGYLP